MYLLLDLIDCYSVRPHCSQALLTSFDMYVHVFSTNGVCRGGQAEESLLNLRAGMHIALSEGIRLVLCSCMLA